MADLAGWWFARALAAVAEASADDAPAGPGDAASVLAGSSGESGVRAALATLPPVERDAVLLRDAYDLPLSAVAVALGIPDDTAREIVTAGRLHLVAVYDDRTPPDLTGHVGRTVVTLVALRRRRGRVDGVPARRVAPPPPRELPGMRRRRRDARQGSAAGGRAPDHRDARRRPGALLDLVAARARPSGCRARRNCSG